MAVSVQFYHALIQGNIFVARSDPLGPKGSEIRYTYASSEAPEFQSVGQTRAGFKVGSVQPVRVTDATLEIRC